MIGAKQRSSLPDGHSFSAMLKERIILLSGGEKNV